MADNKPTIYARVTQEQKDKLQRLRAPEYRSESDQIAYMIDHWPEKVTSRVGTSGQKVTACERK